jgi:DNA-binding NarL/FixJ family response regulator
MRVLIADLEPRVRRALRVLLGRQPDLEVVGEAPDAQQLLLQMGEYRPDLVLLDWRLTGAAPEQLLADLRQVCPGLQVIALSGRPEQRTIALAAGANAFACKCDAAPPLLAAIEARRRPKDAAT